MRATPTGGSLLSGAPNMRPEAGTEGTWLVQCATCGAVGTCDRVRGVDRVTLPAMRRHRRLIHRGCGGGFEKFGAR